jgi:hypothetical protein
MRTVYFIISLFFCAHALGQDSTKIARDQNDWQFRVGPYYWFVGMEASLVRPPKPSSLPELEPRFDLKLPYSEVQNALKFAFLMNTDFARNRWLGVLNATSFILEGDAITPKEIVLKNSNYRLAMAFGEVLGGYEIISKKKFKIQGLLGAKVIYNSISVNATYGNKEEYSGERDGLWVEPVIATQIKYLPTTRIECMLYADYGPIRSKEELTNQVYLNVSFLLNKWLYVAPGYRYWLFRLNESEAIFNGQMYGFYIRLGGQF